MNAHKAKRATTQNRDTGNGDIAHDIVDVVSLTAHSGDSPQLIRLTQAFGLIHPIQLR
jgi:hypothetical protein